MTYIGLSLKPKDEFALLNKPVSVFAALRLTVILVSVVGILLIAKWDMLLNDADTYWHIEAGSWIITNRAFPRFDVWSHTFAGDPWIAKEWLSQVVLYFGYVVGGWRGVVILTLIAYLGSLGYLALWLLKRIQLRYAACILALVFMLSAGSLLARPHVLALPAVLAWTLGLLYQIEKSNRPPWWLILVMFVWSNLHAGFTIGFLIAGLIGLEAVIRAGKDWFKTGLQWALFGLMAIVATCIGPYGIQPYLITIKLFSANEAVGMINEWRPLALDGVGIASVSILGALLLGLSVRFKQNWIRIILIGILGVMMVKYTRFGLLFAFTAIPIALAPLLHVFRELGKTPLDHPIVNKWLVAVFVLGFIAASALVPAPRPNPSNTPQEALEAARAGKVVGPVYNSYSFGGFLIYNHVPTYVDSRTDQLFIDGFLSKMRADAQTNDPTSLVAQLNKTKVEWALLEPTDHEAQLLTKAGWTIFYKDAVAIVLIKPK
jgi:hypothetical protein